MATRTMSIRWIVIWARLAIARGTVNRQNPREVARPTPEPAPACRVPGPRVRSGPGGGMALAGRRLGRARRRTRRSQNQPPTAAGM